MMTICSTTTKRWSQFCDNSVPGTTLEWMGLDSGATDQYNLNSSNKGFRCEDSKLNQEMFILLNKLKRTFNFQLRALVHCEKVKHTFQRMYLEHKA